MELPMTRAIEKVFEHLPNILDKQKVCSACRDKTRCKDCLFYSDPNPPDRGFD
jgi:hypothetical protein